MADKRHVTFVTTTINIPEFIEGYLQNFQDNGHSTDSASFLVIGDLKTPSEVKEYCKNLTEEYGFDVEYMGVDEQASWAEEKNITEFHEMLPFNSIQRRNIGYLKAYEGGTDIIVSLDDDNLARDEEDVLKEFKKVGSKVEMQEVEAPNQWFNCCSLMEYENEDPREVYPRGFPYSRRDESQQYKFKTVVKELAIKAGLWTYIPDVDVITHLERGPRSSDLREKHNDETISLARDNFCPVNTQNTGYDSDILPLMFAIPMGDTVKGMEVSRFDDIWMGFFAEKILHAQDKAIGFGRPVSYHDRNVHNLKAELEHEAIGIRINEIVVNILEDIKINKDSYLEAYEDLIRKFRSSLEDSSTEPEFIEYLHKTLDRMGIWLNACKKVMEQ